MQRSIASFLGIAAVLFGFFVFFNSQAEQIDTTPVITAPEVSEEPAAEAELVVDSEPVAEEPAAPAENLTAAQDALEKLNTVDVTPATRIPDYDRDLFGRAWADVDGNGCDTRNDILARDLTVTATEGSCKILAGQLADPYTGKTIDFTRGQKTSTAVQIDHIHSLSGAWKAGAWAWSDDERTAFANDPENLLAADGPANGSKSDKGPSMWMPSDAGNDAFNCTYATSYAHILVKYDLTAPASDIATLRDTLATC